MKKVGLLLAGSGVYDGSEIREAVLCILALEEMNAEIVFLAPNIAQTQVINHQNGEVQTETRNVLEEAARIARGPVQALEGFETDALDALVVPGGFGVAKNLSDFAFTQSDYSIETSTENFLKALMQDRKPMGFACIAPILAAKLFPGVNITIGNDANTAARLEALGAKHHACEATDIVQCSEYPIVTTPAYMLDAKVAEIAKGIQKMVTAVLAQTHLVTQ